MANMVTRTEAPNGLIRQIARTGTFISLMAACLLAGFGSAPVQAQGMTLDICPTDYGSFPENAPPLTCGCAADAVKKGNVCGANPYYYQSSLCRAALHAGAIGAEGGQIVVKPEKATIFPAVPRNGVTADSWGEGMGFRVVAAGQPPAPTPPPAAGTATPPQATGMTLDICPTDYGSFPEDAPPLTCGCSAAAVKTGNVRGANPYYYQSSLCRAALHAGAIGAQGGQIVVQPEKAAFFPAVPRNGVAADSWGEGMGFRVAVAGNSPRQAGCRNGQRRYAVASHGMTLDVCPTNYGSFPEDAPPLTCGCDAASVKQGNVRGANPYYYQSSLCRAALHAGAIGADGGQIVVQPKKSPFFPAVTRNGVAADSWGQGMGFSVTAAAGGRPSASPIFDAGNSAGMTLDICPTDYGSFPEDAPPLTCGCDAAAAKAGQRPRRQPLLLPVVGVPRGAACRRDRRRRRQDRGQAGKGGVLSGGYAQRREGRFLGPGHGVPCDRRAGRHARGRRAATRGRCSGQADPGADRRDPSRDGPRAALHQLRHRPGQAAAVERTRPAASFLPRFRETRRFVWCSIGHTDSQGSAPYNLDLSQRRAAAVYLWLIQHGVELRPPALRRPWPDGADRGQRDGVRGERSTGASK